VIKQLQKQASHVEALRKIFEESLGQFSPPKEKENDEPIQGWFFFNGCN